MRCQERLALELNGGSVAKDSMYTAATFVKVVKSSRESL
jgi:hypothetical protein